MRRVSLIFSAAQLVFALGVILIGGFFLALPHVFSWRLGLAQFFLGPLAQVSLVGLLILALGIVLLVCFGLLYRGRYYVARMEKTSFDVDTALIKQFVDQCLHRVFPQEEIPCDVWIGSKSRLEFCLDLPFALDRDKKKKLSELEGEVGSLLKSQLGYDRPFYFSLFVK